VNAVLSTPLTAALPAALLPLTPPPAFRPLAPRLERAPPPLDLVLDRVADGLVIVDGAARVVHANRAARQLLMRVAPNGCLNGVMAFSHAETQQLFSNALADCLTCRDGIRVEPPADDREHTLDFDAEDALPPARQFLVRAASGRVVARATIEPLARRSQDAGRAAHQLVTLHAQPDAAQVCVETLSTLYGLTAAEARVASTVIGAGCVDGVAARLALSRNTVKSHLKRVFCKCGVQSLAALASLLATGPRLR
jgi:DNA-binding CsgD family transcriptional regulator